MNNTTHHPICPKCGDDQSDAIETTHPCCRNCRYDLSTQIQLQHPGWQPGDEPVEIHCTECDQRSTWPWVGRPSPPARIPISSILVSFVILAAVGAVIFALVGYFGL